MILATGNVLDVTDITDVAGRRPVTPSLAFLTFGGDHVPSLDELKHAHILRVLALLSRRTRIYDRPRSGGIALSA